MSKIQLHKSYLLLIFTMLTALLSSCSNQANPVNPDSKAGQTQVTTATDDAAKKLGKIVIGWVPPDITGVYKIATTYMEKSAEDAKKSGLDVEILTKASNNHGDANAQIHNIEDMIQRKVSAIIISPADVEPLKPVLKQAKDAKIPVIIVNLLTPIEGTQVDTYIGFDNAQAAEVSAYAMLNALGGPGVLDGKGKKVEVKPNQELDLKWWQNVYKDVDPNSIKGKIAILSGVPGSFYDNERQKGFDKVLKMFPNVQVVTKLPADWNRQKGVSVTENILQKHKDIDGIWAASNEMGLGAINAVQNAGLTGKVFVTTNDGTSESVDRIREDKILSETWHGFPEWGWYGVKFGVMLHLGEETPKTYDIRPRTEYKANANDFYPNPVLEPIDWKQIITNAKLK
ncbi:sugar ABC transporter substrate-binding protein [Paenibacillus sp. HWE-109]|uniref:sugar ABC transporter substrate-binding protein n=1 Tax=Paenibacillus sp. HWE-109 TaxID=1306526 RepID=UPI001EDFC174|nr:sugar ABC transporter substrate-binding protein [Paenibacillus sp. HWE-109]UKS24507.1 sugar ABC transporter substrate-binding protein [Paenibacillus sp. HWE-109]